MSETFDPLLVLDKKSEMYPEFCASSTMSSIFEVLSEMFAEWIVWSTISKRCG